MYLMRKESLLPETQKPKSQHQISRRSFMSFSLVASAAASNAVLLGVLQQIDLDDELTPGESIVGKDLKRALGKEYGYEKVYVTIKTSLQWEINGKDYNMSHLIIDYSSYAPDCGIPNTDYTIENGTKDIVVSKDGSGFDIKTTLGDAHISAEEFDNAVFQLAHPKPVIEPQEQTITIVDVDVEIRPNPEAQTMLNVVNGCNNLRNITADLGLTTRVQDVEIPDRVKIEFTCNHPPPVLEYDPKKQDEQPEFTVEQIAALRKKHDDLFRLLSEKMLTSK